MSGLVWFFLGFFIGILSSRLASGLNALKKNAEDDPHG